MKSFSSFLLESEGIVKEIHGSVFHSKYYPKDKTLYDRIKYLHPSEVDREEHIIYEVKGKVVGDLGLQVNPYEKDKYWLKHISVDPKFKNQGIATKLIDAMFKKAEKEKMGIQRSSPSEEGKKYLTDLMNRMKQKYPHVPVEDAKRH